MGGLSNEYIENLMYTISINPENFKGVKPCDHFLEYIGKNCHLLKPGDCFIINLSSSNHGGSHFVCLIINSKHNGEYFDSYGLHYSLDSNINKAIKISKLKTAIFEKPLQNLSSQFCGLYCSKIPKLFFMSDLKYFLIVFCFSVAYLLWRQVGLTKKAFGNLFASDVQASNDQVALDVIKLFIEESVQTVYKE